MKFLLLNCFLLAVVGANALVDDPSKPKPSILPTSSPSTSTLASSPLPSTSSSSSSSTSSSRSGSKQNILASTNIHENLIPGSSDYVPTEEKQPKIKNATIINDIVQSSSNKINTTNSNANVFQGVPSNSDNNNKKKKNGDKSSMIRKDPLQVNAQQQNPFLSGIGNGAGGINPQIMMLLRNNPRLQMLARQNPIIAQQIMRNPQLLRDPMIQRAIQSQLGSSGQGPNLLGQIGQLGLNGLNGLGRALNPLGLPPIGSPMGTRGNTNGLNNLNNNNQISNHRNQQRSRLGNNNNGLGGGQSHNKMNPNKQLNEDVRQNPFGLPFPNRNLPNPRRQNPHMDTLNGGYYGDNQNYNNPPIADNNEVDDNGIGVGDGAGGGGGGGDGDEENTIDPGHQDYGDNTGEENGDDGGGGDGSNGGGEDAQQNPADDPDIQQLQNFGGPMNDNFPEGLFPPGLLTKEDIEEIRRQQEKQQRESEERERQQQQQQNQQETSSPDYEDNGGGQNGDEEGGAGGQDEAPGTEQPEVTTVEEENNNINNNNNNHQHNAADVDNENHHHHHHQHQQHQGHNPNEMDHTNHNGHHDHTGFTTPAIPPAFRNSYHPIQPGHGNHPTKITHQNEYQNVPDPHGPVSKNHFNMGSNVEYEPVHHQHHDLNNHNLHHHHHHGYPSTTISPSNINKHDHTHRSPHLRGAYEALNPSISTNNHPPPYPPRSRISQWARGGIGGGEYKPNPIPRPIVSNPDASPESIYRLRTTPSVPTPYSGLVNDHPHSHHSRSNIENSRTPIKLHQRPRRLIKE